MSNLLTASALRQPYAAKDAMYPQIPEWNGREENAPRDRSRSANRQTLAIDTNENMMTIAKYILVSWEDCAIVVKHALCAVLGTA